MQALSHSLKLRNIIKSALSVKLPRHTTNSFLYTANRYGGLGLYSMEDNLDVARITQFFNKCLTSPDDIVKHCAWTQLSQVVGKLEAKEARHLTTRYGIFLKLSTSSKRGFERRYFRASGLSCGNLCTDSEYWFQSPIPTQ